MMKTCAKEFAQTVINFLTINNPKHMHLRITGVNSLFVNVYDQTSLMFHKFKNV